MIANSCGCLLLLTLSLSGTEGSSSTNTTPHREQNALYRQVLVGGPKGVPPLPAPSLEDGMNAAKQQAAIAALPGLRVKPAEFLRDSQVSPISLIVGREPASKDGLRLRSLNLWFVAYGDLDAIVSGGKTFDLFQRDERQQVPIPADQLARRGIEPPGPGVSYTHATFTVLDRVQLQETLRTQWSKTADSVVTAGTIDPRFTGDREYPNSWRPINPGPNNVDQLGPASPYNVQVFYLKATRLVEPAGAILVEYHSQFENPPGWFNGRDLLPSKLPIAVETSVRSFRRRLAKMSRPAP